MQVRLAWKSTTVALILNVVWTSYLYGFFIDMLKTKSKKKNESLVIYSISHCKPTSHLHVLLIIFG